MAYAGSFNHQSNVNPAYQTEFGADNFGTDSRELYHKLFSGEMFKGFQNNTIARDLVMRRTLRNGKSLQFIFTGRTNAEFHTPGNSILGSDQGAPPVAEKTITCDDLLISSAFVYELDEVLSHYDLRSEISRKIGYALAEKYDRLIFRAVTKAARQASPVSATNFVEPGGTQIRLQTSTVTDASAAYNSDALITGFYDAAAALDEKGVSQDGRVAVLNPRQYYALIKAAESNALINRDVVGDALQSGKGLISIAGIEIFKSMNIPFFGHYGTKYGAASATEPGVTSPQNIGDFIAEEMEDAEKTDSGFTNSLNDYGVGGEADGVGAVSEFRHSCGLIFQREAAGCVEAIGPQVQVTSGDASILYQGDVIVGRMAMGADALNPAAAVELIAGANPGDAGTTAIS